MNAKLPVILPVPQSSRFGTSTIAVAAFDMRADEGFYDLLGALREDLAEYFGESVTHPLSSREQFAFFGANSPEETVLWGANFREESGRIGSLALVKDAALLPGAYRLEAAEGTISLYSFDAEGMAAAVATLLQILLQSWDGWRWLVPDTVIEDAPALGWRGLMIDVSRHFMPIATLKRMVRLAALWKINRLHWHLSDDQGWRVALDGHPELELKASTRGGGDPHKNGCYLKEEIREFVSFATARGISIMPELDLPGHVRAVLAARPDLACGEGPFTVWEAWGIADDVLCMGKDASLAFAKEAWAELIELFPAPWVHIGGDECPTTRWESCPRCRARKESLGLEKWEDLQGWFIRELSGFLRSRGKEVFGWDEVLDSEISQSGGPVNVFHWRAWLPEQGAKALEKGLKLVSSPFSPWYLDFVQSDDRTSSPGLAYRSPKASTLERVFKYDPFAGLATAGSPEDRSAAAPDTAIPAGFLGVQANAWTEYIRDGKRLEYMLFPRLVALAQRGWCGQNVGSWEAFREQLASQRVIFDRLAINAAPLR